MMRLLDWLIQRPYVAIMILIVGIGSLTTCLQAEREDYQQRCQAVGGIVVMRTKDHRICIQAKELNP